MARDAENDRFAGFDPVTRRMCETLLGLEYDFHLTQQIIDEARGVIAQKQELITAALAGQDQLRANASKLQQAGLVMGYDLFKLMDQTRPRPVEPEIGPPAPTSPPSIAEPPPASFSVKQFVLEYVESKFPNFVAAASIERRLKELGHDVHPKTVGMSLYRWSQKGFVRREGKSKWFYVPEDQREQPAQQEIELADEESV